MKGKLVCLIGLAIGGFLTGIIVGEKRNRSLKLEQNNLDAKLAKLHQDEHELLREIESYRQKSEEEIQKTQELISVLKGLDLMDPTEMDITIDPE